MTYLWKPSPFVWFFVGLSNDVIFYYPPVLFVIGLIGFFKGLMD